MNEFYCCVMYSGVEYVVCCYSECISHTRLIFQLAWCGIYTQSNNTLHTQVFMNLPCTMPNSRWRPLFATVVAA